MTIEEVVRRVEKIREIAGDDEAAHSAEDRLWQDVLTAIAKGAPNAQGMAQWALETTTISFARWCA